MKIDALNSELNKTRIALAKAEIALHAVILYGPPLPTYTRDRVDVALAAAREALHVTGKDFAR